MTGLMVLNVGAKDEGNKGDVPETGVIKIPQFLMFKCEISGSQFIKQLE